MKEGIYWGKLNKHSAWGLFSWSGYSWADFYGLLKVVTQNGIREVPEVVGPFVCQHSYRGEKPPSLKLVKSRKKAPK